LRIYNRKDADAMAAVFAEDGIRITPSAIFQGRDAIRRDTQNMPAIGLCDYSVYRTLSGTWFLHRYHRDRAPIMEETVTIAAAWTVMT
jgi:ketosteroid isomerase-like protein